VDELTREFLIESQEGLDRMERCLTELEERPSDNGLLAEIFRAVHTIKGTTGFLGYARLEKLAHAGENLLGLLRDGKLQANQAIISALLSLMDGLRAILRTIEVEGQESAGEDTILIERLIALQQTGTVAVEAVAVAVTACASGAATEVSPTASIRTASLLPDAPMPEIVYKATEAPSGNAVASPANSANPRSGTAGSTAESTLRVDVTLLNRMMNLVGELVLTRNQILQATSNDANLTVLSRRLDMVTADLRENVMKARMQPVSHVFSKFPRLVRDLSQGLGRKVRLQMDGQETELDKSLLEAIKDPLTHAVRNSLDHGIEPPEVRIAQGKDPEGLLRLRAYQEGSHVMIEVSDDGAGVRVDKVRDKAIERGLVTQEQVAQMNERELQQLVFLPGFSTAEQVTKVSGRGVGMDVVRTNVEKIGGKVELDSRAGRGTTLRLRISLTLVIIPALIVVSRNQSFALPQGALSELVHISPEQDSTAIEWIENAPLYRLRGNLLPLIFLDRILGNPALAGPIDHDRYIAVLNAEGRRFGLVVDGLADPEEIVVKPLSAVLKQIGCYSGATVLGNGNLALILDPGALANKAGEVQSSEEEQKQVQTVDEFAENIAAEFLLVEAGGRQAAIPLSDVLRIERLPRKRIEYLGHRPVLNFNGNILPVEDQAGLLDQIQDPERQITVVVCCDGDRHMGFAVEQVLDVAVGSDLSEAGTELHATGVTLLKDHVTNIVDLSGVSALDVVQTAQQWEAAQ
jgi:two-component system chemotaxis sensor kinase CheA